MWCYTILSDNENKLTHTLSAALEACGFDVLPVCAGAPKRREKTWDRQIALVSEDEEGCIRMLHPHMVIVPPALPPEAYAYRPAVRCAAAVLPGSLRAEIAGKIDAKCLVTYGMSSKDTITVSSAKDTLMLSVQRELIDLSGKRTEIQEIRLHPLFQENQEYIMAAAGVLLLSGIPAAGLGAVL